MRQRVVRDTPIISTTSRGLMNRTPHLRFVPAPPATSRCKPVASAPYRALPRKCWRISGGPSMGSLMSERGVPVGFRPENPQDLGLVDWGLLVLFPASRGDMRDLHARTRRERAAALTPLGQSQV